MSNYKVTLKTSLGEQTYTVQGNSLKQVTANVESSIKNNGVGVYQYTIEQQVGVNLDQNAVSGLFNASMGLIGCIVVLFVAEYKLRMMFKS